LIDASLRKPVTVAVGVLFVVLFGTLSLFRIPVQLTPDITRPEITVYTRWPGASPHEIEREIVDEQEEHLKGVEGVERITSQSVYGEGTVVLRYPSGTDMDSAVVNVANRLQQVPSYPVEADRPILWTTRKTDNAVAWFILLREAGNDQEIENYYTLLSDYVKPRLERVSGVAVANVFGGREDEIQVVIRPEELAARGLTIPQVLRALDIENTNTSAGDFSEGKRKYLVRFVGEYRSIEDVKQVVLFTHRGNRVYVGDVAEVQHAFKKRTNFVRQKGQPALAINCVRQAGANVLDTMAGLREVVTELNAGYLPARGLYLTQVYDETQYINASIGRVVSNLLLGSALAVAVLFFFLRNVASTLIIAVAIPISVIGSFVLLLLLGRTVNVISLAGMTFAAGMVVDNSIVSLENIFRLRQAGQDARAAAAEGARGVWGAILASTATTVAVFLPIFFGQEQSAQLFKDIAIAISCSVALSLVVSMTVIPAMAARLLRGDRAQSAKSIVSGRTAEFLARTVGRMNQHLVVRLGTIVVLTAGAIWGTFALAPDLEYLPEGNRNLVIGTLLPPPGYSIEEMSSIGADVERKLSFLFADPASDPTADGDRQGGVVQTSSTTRNAPSLESFFFVATESAVFLGARARDPERARELIPLFREALSEEPGMIAIARQSSLFERGRDGGRRVDIEISGPELDELVRLGSIIFGRVLARFPSEEGHQAQPIPSLDLQSPEIHIRPDRERTKDLGLDARQIGITVDAILDGIKASDYQFDGREIDLTLMGGMPGQQWRTQDFENLPLHTPEGKTVTLGSVADVEVTRGPQQISHIEEERSIIVRVIPAPHVPIETVLRILRAEIVGPLLESDEVADTYDVRLAGTADDLANAFSAFRWNFLLAVVITYLFLCALLESFAYPLVILFSVPLAAVGGVAGLVLVDRFVAPVSLDILTMLGFVILVGVVVNNAILIVYLALQGIREGQEPALAISEAVRLRVRPILMSSLTSGIGMLPLVVVTGAGSELYRGLGSVVVGGLLVSTVFTVFLVPAVLATVLRFCPIKRVESAG
jgi:HAE1 family hydrophobic/amphiphilic exporter-1